jgi:hypothetical protein
VEHLFRHSPFGAVNYKYYTWLERLFRDNHFRLFGLFVKEMKKKLFIVVDDTSSV